MNKWSEFHTAFSVARLGTISAAADALRVHRATVIRHINSLESELDTKLFFRHARGYSLTEAGEDMLATATIVDKHLQKLRGLSRQETKIVGDLAISSHEVVDNVLLRALLAYKEKHSRASITLHSEWSTSDLETRRADISIQEGEAPTDLDYVVLPFARAHFGLYANQSYLKQYGLPQSIGNMANQQLKTATKNKFNDMYQDWIHNRGPVTEDKFSELFQEWLHSEGHSSNIVLRSNSISTAVDAIKMGIGVGFCPQSFVKDDPDIFAVWPHQEQWSLNYWIVTHVDAHSSAKVQAVLEVLRGMGFLGRAVPAI